MICYASWEWSVLQRLSSGGNAREESRCRHCNLEKDQTSDESRKWFIDHTMGNRIAQQQIMSMTWRMSLHVNQDLQCDAKRCFSLILRIIGVFVPYFSNDCTHTCGGIENFLRPTMDRGYSHPFSEVHWRRLWRRHCLRWYVYTTGRQA